MVRHKRARKWRADVRGHKRFQRAWRKRYNEKLALWASRVNRSLHETLLAIPTASHMLPHDPETRT